MFHQVGTRVWVATSATWSTTSTIVVAEDGAALLVDPALTAEDLTGIAYEIGERGWRVVAGFSTHPHWDHVLWSSALPEVPRWATPEAAAWTAANPELLVAQAGADLPGHRWEVIGGTTALPDDAAELPWPGPRAVVVPSGGHAIGHAGLWLPDEGVYLSGDMLSDIEVPLLDTGLPDPVSTYRQSLETLAEVVAHATVVVPGHGTPADRAEAQRRLAADQRYLEELHTTADPRLASRLMQAEHRLQVQELGTRATPQRR